MAPRPTPDAPFVAADGGLDRVKEGVDGVVATAAAGDQHAAGIGGDAQSLTGGGAVEGGEGVGAHHGADEAQPRRLDPHHLPQLRDVVFVLGDNDPIVGLQQAQMARAQRKAVFDGPLHQHRGAHHIEDRGQFMKTALGEGVDDEHIGAQHRDAGPDPLLGHGEIGEFVDAGGLDNGLGGQLECGESLAKHQAVGLRRGEKPMLALDVGSGAQATKPFVNRHLSHDVADARAVDRVGEKRDAFFHIHGRRLR